MLIVTTNQRFKHYHTMAIEKVVTEQEEEIIFYFPRFSGWPKTCIDMRHIKRRKPNQRGFPSGAQCKEFACQCRRHKRCGFNPWVRKYFVLGYKILLQYPCLENIVERGAWWAIVHGVTKSQTSLSTCAHTHTHVHT